MTKVKNIDGFPSVSKDFHMLAKDKLIWLKAKDEIGELDITLDIEKTMILLDKYILTHNFPITGIHQLREIATALSKGDILK